MVNEEHEKYIMHTSKNMKLPVHVQIMHNHINVSEKN